MSAPGDAALISRVQAGDADAFEGLVTRYKGLVYSAVCRILSDRDAASDVAQEAFFKAYASIGRLNEPAAFRSWLLRIASNEAFRYLKEKRPELLAEESSAGQSPWSAPADPVDETIRRMTGKRIEASIGRLPPIYRAALTLRYYGKLPYKDIADSLGITLTNVKFRIHHGARLLRAILGKEDA